MLVRIPASRATIGMFVQKIECSWWEHPFWRSSQTISSGKQLAMIQQSGAEYIIIDDEKGIACRETSAVQSAASPLAPSTPPSRDKRRSWLQPTQAKSGISGKERRAEVRKARTVLNRSKQAVKEMFDSARMGKAIQTRKMASMVRQLTASLDKDPTIILNMARLKTKDDYTYLHSVSVCALMINLARVMRLDEALVREAGMAGLLHDVGKLAIPDEILLKPSRLNEAEFQIVRDHPLAGYKILAASGGVSDATLDVCLHHHEKMDGTGYPHNRNADELNLLTRMASICDVYDAITSQRVYNSPWTASEALSQMQSWSGHFDQMILRSFVESLQILPIGTLLQLTNAHLAIVIGEAESDYSLPKVRIFYSVEKATPIDFYDIEISRSAYGPQISGVEDPLIWGFDDWNQMKTDLLVRAPLEPPKLQQETEIRPILPV
jgi:putative nucleotidyltransferase with HDIG domain